MLQYAIAIYPLITHLKDPISHKHCWYADDSSCAGELLCNKEWLLLLLKLGPSYGYFTEPSKSIIILKEEHLDEAKRLLSNLDVEVTLASTFLGGCIGRESKVCAFGQSKVARWVNGVQCLVKAARSYPQSTNAAFTYSLSMEWTYLQCLVTGCDNEYVPLRGTIQRVFTPAVLGREVLRREHKLFALPAKTESLAPTCNA